MTRHALPLSLALLAAGAAPGAHHSLTGIYDTSRNASIDGVVTAFHFVNPHPYLLLKVNDGGRTMEWRLELDNRRELVNAGITETSLRPGDRVVVSGSPGREEQRIMYVRALERPADGFAFEQVGSSPRLRPRPR